VPASFTVECRDAERRRVHDGGAAVEVSVQNSSGAVVECTVSVRDAGDGSYGVTYSVPSRGDYSLHVLVDGGEVAGSPFSVFFAAGLVSNLSLPPVQLASVASMLGGALRSPCNDFINGKCFRADCRYAHDAAGSSHALALSSAYPLPSAAEPFEELGRTLCVPSPSAGECAL
jgi:Filamin/ABP280 repeat